MFEEEPYHEVIDGQTRADVYCVKCGNQLGWKLTLSFLQIAVTQPSRNELIYWDEVTLLQRYQEQVEASNDQDLGANEQNADQDRGDHEQVPNEQDLGANEQNADQDGGANEQVPNEQEGGANEQDGGANEQDGGVNEQVPNQDVDIAEGIDNFDLNQNI
ncbi:hypothetical protein T459_18235 [Capsicum annuum]|uniref:Yippee domain-containing protein n=1 Tax=Capsicum annuum TaxID=4072 RepID=A0A2G2ZDU6_CAPAN|nr:hypothetical protein T459_18235 [Capsicum annuum]